MNTPNVLFILADDLGWGDVGCHDSYIATPTINRLARLGLALDRHYVCPFCGHPSAGGDPRKESR